MTSTGNGAVATTDRDLIAEVATYIAQCCTRTDVINGKIFRSAGAASPDAHITVDVERVNFGGDNIIVQVELRPTKLVIVPPNESSPPPALPTGLGSLDLPDGGTA